MSATSQNNENKPGEESANSKSNSSSKKAGTRYNNY